MIYTAKTAVVIGVAAYLLGSVNIAILVSRCIGTVDPRTAGSGNPGATNVLRLMGKKIAFGVLLLDILKGWLPVWGIQHFFPNTPPMVVAMILFAVILGHLYPIFFRFQGGKGVATAIGALLGLAPLLGAAFIGTWLVALGITRRSSAAALSAALLTPWYAAMGLAPMYIGACSLLTGLLLWRHRANMHRLVQGKENPIF